VARHRFLEPIGEQADALVVTGVIAESNSLGTALRSLAELTGGPPRFSKLNRPHGIRQFLQFAEPFVEGWRQNRHGKLPSSHFCQNGPGFAQAAKCPFEAL
jgi:hypothetical protein